jgi:hypothetical protein
MKYRISVFRLHTNSSRLLVQVQDVFILWLLNDPNAHADLIVQAEMKGKSKAWFWVDYGADNRILKVSSFHNYLHDAIKFLVTLISNMSDKMAYYILLSIICSRKCQRTAQSNSSYSKNPFYDPRLHTNHIMPPCSNRGGESINLRVIHFSILDLTNWTIKISYVDPCLHNGYT